MKSAVLSILPFLLSVSLIPSSLATAPKVSVSSHDARRSSRSSNAKGNSENVSSQRSSNKNNKKDKKNKKNDDPVYPLVSSSPLIVAVTCQDGVAMVATYPETPPFPDNKNHNSVDYDVDWQDHSLDPPRIQNIDDCGTALVAAGFRTDCGWLAQIGRSITAEERSQFGPSSSALSSVLPSELSLFLAERLAGPQRPVYAVALLATASNQQQQPQLHLVDATGAYPVRAHAVGQSAKLVNRRLRRVEFSSMTADQGAERLLKLLQEPKKEDEEEGDDWKPHPKLRVEVAIARPSQTLKRVRRPFLFDPNET